MVCYVLMLVSHLLYPVNTEQHGSEWELVGVVDNRQRGSSERVREKMMKMRERAAALVGEREQVEKALAMSQANERKE